MNMNFKLQFYISIILLFPLLLSAQVLNGGFESWTMGNPNEWLTNNIPGALSPVTQSASSHSGSYAARGEVLQYLNEPYPPLLYGGAAGSGFAVSQRYATLSGYYQFSPVGGDQLYVYVYLHNNFIPIAFGETSLGATSSGYSQFNITLEYISGETPTTCILEVVIIDSVTDVVDVGSTFLIDDVSLSGTTAIEDRFAELVPENFLLEQNYPNPFNPSTTIEYSISTPGPVRLDIYNELGEWVSNLVDGPQPAGQHAVQWRPENMASGIYLYRVETSSGIQTRKMIYVK